MNKIIKTLVATLLWICSVGITHAALFANDELAIQSGLEAIELGNYAEAYCLWRPLADKGDVRAQNHIGWLYANGHGLKVDVPKAISWWEKAAASGHAESQFALGMTYLTGDGDTIKKNVSEAIHWLVKAANNGNLDAQELVLQLLETRKDKVLALYPNIRDQEWTKKASKPKETGKTGTD